MEKTTKIWVSSPDGTKTEEHTPLNAHDLIQNAGWVRTSNEGEADKVEDVKNEENVNKSETSNEDEADKVEDVVSPNDADLEKFAASENVTTENVTEQDESGDEQQKNEEKTPSGNKTRRTQRKK
jgi:hypothetical protein